jgi:hypothetical protein
MTDEEHNMYVVINKFAAWNLHQAIQTIQSDTWMTGRILSENASAWSAASGTSSSSMSIMRACAIALRLSSDGESTCNDMFTT